MKLAVFDIDGTLTNTNSVDDICFVQAFADAHAIREFDTDWAGYPHTTDSGITEHVFQSRFGRAPEAEELTTLQQCFMDLMKQQCALDASLFAEIEGARNAFDSLRQEANWAVAIATGCWRESALLKLRAVGIDIDDVPAGFAEDGLSREEIVQTAVSKSLAHYRQKRFEKIVSIGDGIWDVRTAARLEIPFLGVGSEDHEAILHQAGATHVIKDFTNLKRVIQSLNDAEIPRSKTQG